MTIKPGTAAYLTALEELNRSQQIDPLTLDFHTALARLHVETCERIQYRCASQAAHAAQQHALPRVFQAGDIEAHADDIQHHCERVLQLIQDGPPGRAPEAAQLARSVEQGTLCPTALVGHVYRQDEAVFLSHADSLSIPVDMLLFIAFACARPVCEVLAADAGPIDEQNWRQPSCPVCGAIACMARLQQGDGQRLLSCQLCATEWIFNRLRCAFCENENHEQLDVLMVDNTVYRIDACTRCLGYIKTVDERAIKDTSFVYIAGIEDLTTMHLDLVAEQQGYKKPVFRSSPGTP